MEELVLKKCLECGALVEVMHPCSCDNCGISCCGSEMVEVKANSVDAAVEKHVPTYELVDHNLIVRVNHVMEEEHYIEWVAFLCNGTLERVYLKPGEEAIVTFVNKSTGTLYAYCNKHGLWKNEIK